MLSRGGVDAGQVYAKEGGGPRGDVRDTVPGIRSAGLLLEGRKPNNRRAMLQGLCRGGGAHHSLR